MADGVGFIKIERQDLAKAFTMEDVARLLPRHGDYSQEVIDHFIAAHTGLIKDIFEKQVEKWTAFNWPFVYNTDTETFDVQWMDLKKSSGKWWASSQERNDTAVSNWQLWHDWGRSGLW